MRQMENLNFPSLISPSPEVFRLQPPIKMSRKHDVGEGGRGADLQFRERRAGGPTPSPARSSNQRGLTNTYHVLSALCKKTPTMSSALREILF